MKQTANYRTQREETEKGLTIIISNYKLGLDEFPLSMYENLIEEIATHKERKDNKNLRIMILGNYQTLSLVSDKGNGDEEESHLYMSMTSHGIVYSSVRMKEDPMDLIKIYELESKMGITFLSSELSIYVTKRGE